VRLVWHAPDVDVESFRDLTLPIPEAHGLAIGRSRRCQVRTSTLIGGRICAVLRLGESGVVLTHAGHVYPIQVDDVVVDASHMGVPVALGQRIRFFHASTRGSDDERGNDPLWGLEPAFELLLERKPLAELTPRDIASAQPPWARAKQASATKAPPALPRPAVRRQPHYGHQPFLEVVAVDAEVQRLGGPQVGRTFHLGARIGYDYDRCSVLLPEPPGLALGGHIYRFTEARSGRFLLHAEPGEGHARIAGTVVTTWPAELGLEQTVELLFAKTDQAAVSLRVTHNQEVKAAIDQEARTLVAVVRALRDEHSLDEDGPPLGIQCRWDRDELGCWIYVLEAIVRRPSWEHGELSVLRLRSKAQGLPPFRVRNAGRELSHLYGCLHAEASPSKPGQVVPSLLASLARSPGMWTVDETRRELPAGSVQQRRLTLSGLSPLAAAREHADRLFAEAGSIPSEVSLKFADYPERPPFRRHSLTHEEAQRLTHTLRALVDAGLAPAGLRRALLFCRPHLHASCWPGLLARGSGLAESALAPREPGALEALDDEAFDHWFAGTHIRGLPKRESYAACLLNHGTFAGERRVTQLSGPIPLSLVLQRISISGFRSGYLAALWSNGAPLLIAESYRSSRRGSDSGTTSCEHDGNPKEVFGLPPDIDPDTLTMDANAHAEQGWNLRSESKIASGSVDLQLLPESGVGRVTTQISLHVFERRE
jgi:hypothetical protein